LAGGEEEELLALRVLLLDLVAIFFLRKQKMMRTFCRWPPNILDENGQRWSTNTLNFTVILHSTTQTRCIILPKVTANALITINNVSCRFFRSFTIV
jgi:hypothetical protein